MERHPERDGTQTSNYRIITQWILVPDWSIAGRKPYICIVYIGPIARLYYNHIIRKTVGVYVICFYNNNMCVFECVCILFRHPIETIHLIYLVSSARRAISATRFLSALRGSRGRAGGAFPPSHHSPSHRRKEWGEVGEGSSEGGGGYMWR